MSNPRTIIEPGTSRVANRLRELFRARELLYFLTKRDIAVRYKQTILGGLWAILQPVLTMVVFSVFFGRMAKIPSEGIPYPIFVYAGLLPWTYFANAITLSGNSLVGNAQLITKLYFPRMAIPMAACLAGLVDFFISFSVLFLLMAWYRFVPGVEVLLFPVLVLLTFLCAVGTGLWLSAANVRYRDIRFVIPFLVQTWMFVSPVIYPVSIVGEKYRWVLALNPMGGIIEAFRASILGHQPVNWGFLGISAAVCVVVLVTGMAYFVRTERSFADVV